MTFIIDYSLKNRLLSLKQYVARMKGDILNKIHGLLKKLSIAN